MKPMKLSHFAEFENKSLYPVGYKHMLEALENAAVYIYDEAGGQGIFVDKKLSIRFKTKEGFESFSLTPCALFNALKWADLGKEKIKYELHGSGIDFTKIEVD